MTDFLCHEEAAVTKNFVVCVNGERRCCPVPPCLVWFSVVFGQMQHVRIDKRVILKWCISTEIHELILVRS